MTNNQKRKLKHNGFKILLTVITIIIYICFLILIGFASFGFNIFPRRLGRAYDLYYLDITPENWVFHTLWSISLAWQFAWLIYAFVCLFRFTRNGELLYRVVDLFNFRILLFFIFNNLLVVGWLFLWTYLFFGWSFLLIVVACITLYFCLIFSLRMLYYNKVLMKNLGLKLDVFAVRLVLQNGLAFYLTWLSFLTCLNFAAFITYGLGCNQTDSSTVTLSIISALAVIYFLVENFIWQRFLLYCYTPWLVLLITFHGILLEHWTTAYLDRNSLMALIMFCFFFGFAVFKLFMICLCKTYCSHRYDKYRETLKDMNYVC